MRGGDRPQRTARRPHEVTVRAIDGDGAASPDSPPVRVEVPPEPDLPPYQPRVNVVREAEDGSTIREVHETDTIEEAEELAERLREELADDPTVKYIDVPGRVVEMGTGAGDPTDAAWVDETLQLSALRSRASGEGVTVAIIEIGDVDRDHPELGDVAPVVAVGPDGPVDASSDTSAHATAVAGALLAGDELVGAAPAATVVPDDIGAVTADDDSLAAAIELATADGADIINISLSSTSEESPAIETAIELARHEGVLIVAGAGNHARDGCQYHDEREHGRPTMPAASPAVLTVGATTETGQRWHCSVPPVGDQVLAPGAGGRGADPAARRTGLVRPARPRAPRDPSRSRDLVCEPAGGGAGRPAAGARPVDGPPSPARRDRGDARRGAPGRGRPVSRGGAGRPDGARVVDRCARAPRSLSPGVLLLADRGDRRLAAGGHGQPLPQPALGDPGAGLQLPPWPGGQPLPHRPDDHGHRHARDRGEHPDGRARLHAQRGCDNRTAASTRAQLLANPDLPIPEGDRL